jgi:hypothetical protein
MGPRGARPARPPADPIRVAALVLPADGPRAGAVLSALRRSKADVAVLEMPVKKERIEVAGFDGFADAVVNGRFVILSAFPAEVLPLPKALPGELIARIRVDRPDGSFVLYAVRSTDAIGSATSDPLDVERLAALALDEELPVVLAGGFGFTDRSTSYRRLDATFRDAMRAGVGAESTLLGPIWTAMLLRTDYVFTSRSWCATAGQTVPLAGAEHAPILASVGACPPT